MAFFDDLKNKYLDILKPVQQTLGNVGQQVQQFTQPARNLANSGGLIQRVAPQVPQFMNQNFSNTQGRFNPIAQVRAVTQMQPQMAQQYRQQVEQFVPRLNVAQNIQNPYYRILGEIGQGIVNTPLNAIAGAAKLPAARNFQQGASDIASIAEAPLSLAGFGVGKQVVNQVGKQGLKLAIKQGAKTGAAYGGLFGGLEGLREGENDTLLGQIGKTALGAGTGTVFGGVTGGALGGAGGLISKFLPKNKTVISELNNKAIQLERQPRLPDGQYASYNLVKPKGMTQPQWEFQLKFNSKHDRNPYKPVYVSDLGREIPVGNSIRYTKNPLAKGLEGGGAKGKTALQTIDDEIAGLQAQVEQQLSQSRGKAELAQSTRSLFSPDTIKDINSLKAMMKGRAFQEGDIETLYSKNPNLIESVLQAVKEVNPNITEASDALNYAARFPNKSATIIKKIPEQAKLKQLNQIAETGVIPQPGGVTAFAGRKVVEKIKIRNLKAEEQAAKADFDNWQKQVFQREGATQTTAGAVKQAVGAVKTGTTSPLAKDVSQLKDISGFTAQTRDVYRNFKAVFGPKFEEAKRIILDPFDRSKGAAIDMQLNWINKLDDGVVKKLGIKRGSRESELVQLYGEKQLTLDQLKQQAPNKWQQIVEADKWFRDAYNNLLGEVNKARQAIYPNNPDKIIPARQDYYRHFRDMQEGFGGLANIFESPSGITSGLSGVSEYTQPKSKFLSFAQKRLGMKSEIDAVGGFLDYIKSASYARNIDPHIERFRALADELATQTTEGANAGKLNNFIEFLQDFSNDLSGKSNPADRFVQKIIPGGRQAFRAINWLNNRVKANVILGNVASSIAQIFNVPQGIASAGIPNSVRGVGKSLASIFTENKPMQQSVFLKERYFGFGNRAYDRFNSGMLHNTKKFAAWMVGALDEVGSRFIWNAHYEKALREGVTNPIKYADDVTRSLVAGRGVGEVPLLQKSKLFQLVAPFQLEVGNLWYVMGDMAGEKAFGKLATLFVANYVFNRGAEAIRGSGVTFDPIQAMIDAGGTFMNEEDKKKGAIRAGGRLTGEVLGNLPVAQSLAQLYPEYGNKDMGLPTRKEFFGREDPTRFGSGLLTTKGLQDPLYKVLPPFGGNQIKKTVEGLQAYGKGYLGKDTAIKTPIEQSPGNAVKSTLFGQYSTPEAQAYFNENKRPLSEKQSELFKVAEDQKKIYGDFQANREFNRQNQTQSTSTNNAEDDLARNNAKRTGQPQESSTKIFYPEDGQIKSVQKDRKIEEPKLTGQTELDKKLISEYKSSITSKINDITTLYKLNELTADEANTKIAQLKALQESTKLKAPKKVSVKKPKKISFKGVKAIKLKIPKAKTIKVKSVKPKKIKIYKLSKVKKLSTKVPKITLT